MRESRSAVLKMLKDRADKDRQIAMFPRPFLADATPYPQLGFSDAVKELASSSRSITTGLKISKAIFLGDVGVGKTCLVNRFCHQIFDSNYRATIGVDFEVERFDILKMAFNLQIWDTAGQDRFRCIASSYYRAASVIVVLFDLTSLMSLSHCPQWLEDALQSNSSQPFIFLVGTKRDLLSDAAYNAVQEQAVKMARMLKAEFWAVSAKTGDAVNDLFYRMAALTFDSTVRKEKENANGSLDIGNGIVTLGKTSRVPSNVPKKKCGGCSS